MMISHLNLKGRQSKWQGSNPHNNIHEITFVWCCMTVRLVNFESVNDCFSMGFLSFWRKQCEIRWNIEAVCFQITCRATPHSMLQHAMVSPMGKLAWVNALWAAGQAEIGSWKFKIWYAWRSHCIHWDHQVLQSSAVLGPWSSHLLGVAWFPLISLSFCQSCHVENLLWLQARECFKNHLETILPREGPTKSSKAGAEPFYYASLDFVKAISPDSLEMKNA